MMNANAQPVDNSPNILVMPQLFHETMDLIFESYEYFQLQDEIEPNGIPISLQGLLSNEMSRITMRLTTVMAWLLARKAVVNGQLSNEEAADEYRIDGEQYCLDANDDMMHLLPDYLVDLLARSQYIYERVWRLDKQLYS